jgi:UDP-glucose 4-epimerase
MKLSKIFLENNIEVVVHLAGLKSTSESVQDPIKYFESNVGGSICLLEAMKNNNLKFLIFSSSATVYGLPKYLPIDESHPTIPVTPYGRTKLQIEEILSDLSNSDPEWKILSLRYFNPVGAHDSGLIYENPTNIPNNLMPCILDVALKKQAALNVYGNNYATKDGTCLRDYVHVMDVAEAHLSAIDFLKNKYGWDVFNIGTGRATSVFEMIKIFEESNCCPIKTNILNRRSGDVASCFASVDKASSLLKWQSKRNIEDMCRSSFKSRATLKK